MVLLLKKKPMYSTYALMGSLNYRVGCHMIPLIFTNMLYTTGLNVVGVLMKGKFQAIVQMDKTDP